MPGRAIQPEAGVFTAKPLRVLYDGVPLLPRRAGIGRYVEQLVRALVELDGSVQPAFLYLFAVEPGAAGGLAPQPTRGAAPGAAGSFAPRSTRGAAPDTDGARGRRRSAFLRRLAFMPFTTALYALAMDAAPRLRGLERRYDIYHETHYVPRVFQGPTVMTVYDLSLERHPETHPRARVWLFKKEFRRRLARVDRFLAISQVVKEELTETFPVDPARVRVTPLGVDHAIFRPAEDTQGPRGLPPRYLLFVGSVEPRKDLATLLEAYAQLPGPLRSEHPLVLVGPPGWRSTPLWRRVRYLGLDDDVRREGYVSDAELAELYRGATAVACPSLYEGFGLPPLEAMACGAPVACSDIPAHREVLEEAALRLPVSDVEAWRDGLRRLLEDGELRRRLSAKGLVRARAFSWRTCAEETLAVYRELVPS